MCCMLKCMFKNETLCVCVCVSSLGRVIVDQVSRSDPMPPVKSRTISCYEMTEVLVRHSL